MKINTAGETISINQEHMKLIILIILHCTCIGVPNYLYITLQTLFTIYLCIGFMIYIFMFRGYCCFFKMDFVPVHVCATNDLTSMCPFLHRCPLSSHFQWRKSIIVDEWYNMEKPLFLFNYCLLDLHYLQEIDLCI